MFSRGRSVESSPTVVEAAPKPNPMTVVEEPALAAPDHFDARWLPDNTVLLADLQSCEGLASAQGGLLLDAAADWWRPAVAAPFAGLGLNIQAVRRLRVVSTDLAAWPDRLLLLLELNAGHDATLLVARGEGVPIVIGEATCRRLVDGPWPHPFAVLDERTVLTGDEAILNAIAGRTAPQFRSEPIRRMMDGKPLQSPADVRFLIDLSAARAAGWRLPSAVFDVWPETRQAWRALWETPVGLDVAMQWPDRLQCKVAFPCESETTAEEVRGALDTLVPLGKRAVAGRLATLAAESGKADPAAEGYAPFLTEATTALQSVQWTLDEKTVLVDVAWGAGPWSLTDAALAARLPLQADWLGAALAADSEQQQRILSGLADYQQAEGAWPSGAVGGSLLPPETRLSWIAELLPYYGHADWHRSLRFGYAWNSPQNRAVTRRPLDRMVNPAVGTSRTEAGYPVTHYVGIGGVGPDAPTLPVDHPRAGVFGFGRRTRLDDIGDGASNAIAILGVTQDLGPWAAGGLATVRPLTKRPYVNGPDGFGSGQADGMLAGMADGSVRFISKDVDPEVIELLATINSRSNVTVAALGDETRPRSDADKPRSDAGTPRPDMAEPAAEAERQPPAAEEAIAAEPARPPLPAVDVVARLAEPFPRIAVTEMPLGQAVALVAQLGGVSVTFDPEGLESLGVSPRDSVSVDHGNAPLAVVLKDLLNQRGLAYVAEGGQVVVTAPAAVQEELVTRRYSVDDLAEDQAALEELAKTVQKLIATESWQGQGGSGRIQAKDRVLHIEQTGLVHHKLLVFFEKLRTARGLPLRSQSPSDWFQLASRRRRASTVLEKSTSLNYREPAPLVEALGRLGVLAGADILIDRRALALEGIPDSEPASVTVADEPMLAALDKLLRPLGLAWRALDASTLQVSTQAALDEMMELEFYPVGPLLDGLATGATLSEQICNRIAGPTWFDAGGPGVIHYDAKGQCLIVRHNQAVQAAVERLLREQPPARPR